jgi:EmrB/QacA subfamily drug resistance transporter
MSTDSPARDRRWLILAILGIAQLMVVLDATVVNVALPSAQKALNFSNDNRQWIVTAYSLAFGSLLLLGGKISDLFGRKWTFIIGLAGFAVASAVGGAAESFIMLAVARAFQGAFGALLAPAALSLLTTTFTDPAERNQAFGIYGAIAGAGASVGLLLGGVLTQYLSWRYCMFVNLAFAVVAIIGGLALLEHHAHERKPHVDIPGAATITLGLFALVYGFSHAETTSWTNGLTLGFLAAGVILLGLFYVIERRVAEPLLPLRVVTDRNRGASFLAMLLASVAMFGVFLFLTYYLQRSRGYSPIKTGLAFLPLTGLVVIVSVVAQVQLTPRFGPRIMVATGMLCGAAGMVLLAQIGVGTHYASGILPGLLLMALGLGFIFATAMNSATRGVEAGDSGVASATVNAAQQVGGALGTALLSTIAASATTSFISGKVPSPALIAQAPVHGYTVAFYVSAAIFVVGATVTGLLYERGVPELDPNAEPVLVGG